MELTEFKSNLFPVLKVLIYIIDTHAKKQSHGVLVEEVV